MLGAAAGAAVAVACLWAGVFPPLLCTLAALVVAFIVSIVITALGVLAGGALGSAVGLAADEYEDRVGDAGADVLECGDGVILSGDWVTDTDHGWNELHDVTGAMIIGRNLQNCGQLNQLLGAVDANLPPPP